MYPDFLIIPMVVRMHPDLQPGDWLVYATVYWYEHMRDGKCTASNESIQKVAGLGDRAVRAALERLEKAGFIKRSYKDADRRNRLEINCLIRYAKTTAEKPTVPKVKKVEKKESPGEFARRYFKNDTEAQRDVLAYLLVAANGRATEDSITKELGKFNSYWTELNKSGTKERWELQQVFDLKRRLATWFSRDNRYSASKAGAGIIV